MPQEQDLGQPGTRRKATLYDQHGRAWHGFIDKRSGYPVGKIRPLGWSAPWLPPQGPETFKFDRDNPTKFRINYEWLLQERARSAGDYDDERTKAALVRGWDPVDPEKQQALDLIVGEREGLQRPEVVVACIQGDPWTLGQTHVVNKKVEKFIAKKKTHLENLMSKYEDFTAPDADLEKRMDLQEQFDPEDTPRGVAPMKPKRQPRAKQVPVTPEAA